MLTRPAWLDEGEDPDYRFSLANERTFLAWIRTSLGLLAAAVAVSQLVPHFRVAGFRVVLATVLSAAGLLVSAASYARWSANERAMRTGRPLAYSPVLLVLAGVLSVVGAGALVLALFAGW